MGAPDNNLSLSLCSGAGGLDLGLERAGWETIAQIEMDRDCIETLKSTAHRKRTPPDVMCARLEEVSARTLRRRLGLKHGQIALLAGGPPCQPFTTHGLRKAIRDKRAGNVFHHYLSFVEEFSPHAVVLENVDGILSAALRHRPLIDRTADRPMRQEEMKGSFLRWLVGEFARLGYAVSWGLVEAADFAVPQYRQRALIIAVRDNVPCFMPTENPNAPRITIREALAGLNDPGPIQPLSERKRAVYAMIPSGGNWRDLPRAIQKKTMGAAFHATGGKSGWWRRLAWDEPSPTILGMPDHSSTGLIHPDEVRCLGLFECAAIQTFPRGTVFGGSARAQYQQVGNAVPPLLATAIGRQIFNHLQGKRQSTPKAPDWRSASANRRIGTHGWAIEGPSGFSATLNVKVREDHIWSAINMRPFSPNEPDRRIA
jgi:DNA (cytosine-5)-methyltransferase 1